MVINIFSLPFHLQKDIAHKMDVVDFRSFRESSKDSRELGSAVKISMDIHSLTCSDVPKFDNHRFYWLNLKKNQNCPRFCVRAISFSSQCSTGDLLAIVKEAERGNLVGKDTRFYLRIGNEMLDEDLLCRFFEIMNIKTLCQASIIYPRYLERLSKIRIENVKFCSPVPLEELLILKASSMTVTTDSFNINAALNQFFTEWFLNQREIVKFRLTAHKRSDWQMIDDEPIFAGLPFSLLWSRETHESSIVANIPLRKLKNSPSKAKSSYFLENKTNKLWITIYESHVCAVEVSGTEEELVSQLFSFE